MTSYHQYSSCWWLYYSSFSYQLLKCGESGNELFTAWSEHHCSSLTHLWPINTVKDNFRLLKPNTYLLRCVTCNYVNLTLKLSSLFILLIWQPFIHSGPYTNRGLHHISNDKSIYSTIKQKTNLKLISSW